MKIAPNGCGKCFDSHAPSCGDHIDTEDGFVQPVLCNECWEKFKDTEELQDAPEGEKQ